MRKPVLLFTVLTGIPFCCQGEITLVSSIPGATTVNTTQPLGPMFYGVTVTTFDCSTGVATGAGITVDAAAAAGGRVFCGGMYLTTNGLGNLAAPVTITLPQTVNYFGYDIAPGSPSGLPPASLTLLNGTTTVDSRSYSGGYFYDAAGFNTVKLYGGQFYNPAGGYYEYDAVYLNIADFKYATTATPEPGTLALMLAGLALCTVACGRNKRSAEGNSN